MILRRIGNTYKTAFGGLAPASWWLSVVMLVNRSGTMVVPFMTLYLTQSQHYTLAQAGIIMSVFGCGAILGAVAGGRFTDRFGFYSVQLISLIGGGILFIVLGQLKTFGSIACGCFTLSLFNDAFRPANATAIAHYSKEENRTRSFSMNRLAANLGWMFGGALGGVIASYNYHLLFWIDGLTNIAAAAMLFLILSPTQNGVTPAKKDKRNVGDAPSPLRDRTYLLYVCLVVFFGAIFFQIFSTLPVYYKQVLHLSPLYYGLIMAMNGLLVVAFEMALVYHLEPKKIPQHLIAYGTLLVGLSFVVFNLLPGGWALAIISALVLTLGEMLAMPFMNTYWVRRTTDDNRGKYAAMITIAFSSAQIIGPFAGTQIAQHFGFTALWWCVGLVSALAAAGFRSLK